MISEDVQYLTFGDRHYAVQWDNSNKFFTQYSATGVEPLISDGVWKIKKLHPTPNKSSVLALAKTDKLI